MRYKVVPAPFKLFNSQRLEQWLNEELLGGWELVGVASIDAGSYSTDGTTQRYIFKKESRFGG